MFRDKVRVLITEDDADSRDMLCLLLAEQNFEVVPADSAEEALRIARAEQFDAYLIDNRLPEISGLELCKRIRQFNSRTPIVFYSGDSDESHKDDAFLAGAQGLRCETCKLRGCGQRDTGCGQLLKLLSGQSATMRGGWPWEALPARLAV